MRVAEIGAGAAASGAHPGAWRAGSRCRLEVEHGLERLELDHDRLGPIMRERLALCHDERNRLSGIDDLLARERLVQPPRPGARQRQLARGQNRDDTGELERGIGADRGDPRVRLVREHEPRVEQSGDLRVGGKAGAAGDLRLGVTAGG